MGNTHQAGIKKDDHGGSCHQQPQATSVAPHQLRAGAKGDDHGVTGCSHDQQPLVVSVVDLDQFPAAAADRARNELQPLGGGHGDETTSMLENCKKDSATDGAGRSNRIDMPQPAAESVTLGHDDDPRHPSRPEPEGVQFVLHTLPVKERSIGDGDGFTAHVKKAVGVAVSGSNKVGDTNNRGAKQYKIRMRGIDAPEMKMEYGKEARNELVKLIGGKCVMIHVYGTDQFGRYLGDIFCDGIFIQEKMLKRGFAWYFRTSEKRPELERWEKEARETRLGLWLSDNPQKPWEWKRDHPRNNRKEGANDTQSPRDEGIENLPWLISKDMETLGREWKTKLENIVAENVELHNYLHELKKNKKEAEDRAKELEKEMERVVADNMKLKLNDQLEESKKNKKKADDRILKLTFFSEGVVAVNMNLHDKLEKLKEENKKAEDRAKESEKEMESVAAVNRELNDQLQELKGQKKVAEDRAAELQFSHDSAAAINMDLLNTLEGLREKSRKAEDRAKESKKETERVVADNMNLSAQIQRLNNKVSNTARNSKKKLQSVIAINMDLNDKLQELQKNNEKANKDGADEPEKESENVVAVEQGNLQCVIVQEKNEQAVEAPSAASPDKVLKKARNSRKKSLNVIAVNMDLKGKLEDLQKNNEKVMDRVSEEAEKETENVVAEEERDLQGVIVLQEKSEQAVEAPSAAPPAKVLKKARNSRKKSLNVIAVNMDLKGKLEDLQKNNEKVMDRVSEEAEKETENVVAEEERDLQGVIVLQEKSEQAVEAPSAAPPAKVLKKARNSRKKSLNVIAVNMDLKGKLEDLQKNNEKVMDRVSEEAEKETENVVAEEERDLQGVIVLQEKSEQAVEAPSAAPPAKSSGEKETAVVWRKKTAAMQRTC